MMSSAGCYARLCVFGFVWGFLFFVCSSEGRGNRGAITFKGGKNQPNTFGVFF